jgi:hypothetical protein
MTHQPFEIKNGLTTDIPDSLILFLFFTIAVIMIVMLVIAFFVMFIQVRTAAAPAGFLHGSIHKKTQCQTRYRHRPEND